MLDGDWSSGGLEHSPLVRGLIGDRQRAVPLVCVGVSNGIASRQAEVARVFSPGGGSCQTLDAMPRHHRRPLLRPVRVVELSSVALPRFQLRLWGSSELYG